MPLTPEQQARKLIDKMLAEAGWVVQDRPQANLGAGLGVAVREWQLETGFVDYMLFVDRIAVGVIEAKKIGTTLSNVAEQSARYLMGLPSEFEAQGWDLHYAYESTGVETKFRDARDPDPRSRDVFTFHRPETLARWRAERQTLRQRLRGLPPLITRDLRDCQVDAVHGLEASLAADKPRALIQMATGAGKTYTAVTAAYRLIKHADMGRILFLVDRRSLGKQALAEFQGYVTPDDGRKFTELYNVQHMTTNAVDGPSKVCITTIQRLFSMLKGDAEFAPENEERSQFEMAMAEATPQQVAYNAALPPSFFDLIVIDECHRSIYSVWSQVLDYFDAYQVGLTATPSKRTLAYFQQNLVSQYSHEQAVVDGVNVGYDVYRISTRISTEGGHIDAGPYVPARDKLTRQQRWEALDEDLDYTRSQLDRKVMAPDQIRTIIRTFRERLFTEIFPGRTVVPKTLIFAKDDNHAETIVEIVRDEFGKGNDFCKKITYRAHEPTDRLISDLRNQFNLRVAVTVDMISTGTDVKPLECLIFMRDVASSGYFEQMKGRGTRVVDRTTYQQVAPDAQTKERFVIVDAVGVFDSVKSDSHPMDRQPSVPLLKLMENVAFGIRDDDVLASLASRLSRMDRGLNADQRQELTELAGGRSPARLAAALLGAADPDAQIAHAREMFGVDAPLPEQIEQAARSLVHEACAPFDDPALRNRIDDIRRQNLLWIDQEADELLQAGHDEQARERARETIQRFEDYLAEHRDELTALQILYERPYRQRRLAYAAIRELGEAIRQPPLGLTTEGLWTAYQTLHRDQVRGARMQRITADLVSLVRYAGGLDDELAPFSETVQENYRRWLAAQEAQGRAFTAEERQWLDLIREHVADALAVSEDDLQQPPFYARGGAIKARQVFGREALPALLEELSEVLVA